MSPENLPRDEEEVRLREIQSKETEDLGPDYFKKQLKKLYEGLPDAQNLYEVIDILRDAGLRSLAGNIVDLMEQVRVLRTENENNPDKIRYTVMRVLESGDLFRGDSLTTGTKKTYLDKKLRAHINKFVKQEFGVK